MANDALTQHALATEPQFLSRLGAALSKVAWQVYSESPQTANHTQRRAYAAYVLANVPAAASVLAPSMVMRTNIFNFTTSYDFSRGDRGTVVTASGDADIESQLATDWNTLAGV